MNRSTRQCPNLWTVNFQPSLSACPVNFVICSRLGWFSSSDCSARSFDQGSGGHAVAPQGIFSRSLWTDDGLNRVAQGGGSQRPWAKLVAWQNSGLSFDWISVFLHLSNIIIHYTYIYIYIYIYTHPSRQKVVLCRWLQMVEPNQGTMTLGFGPLSWNQVETRHWAGEICFCAPEPLVSSCSHKKFALVQSM